MKKRDKKYVAMVNGELVYKNASGVSDLKNLLRREALERTGKFILTDYRCIEVKNANRTLSA
ncbi:MAG: hypothetical protein IPL84_03990 [Chitinophagaceae bacterium]|nr:hypothetical protein [Chitinophagaceae bacterium]